jgi:hypothetical protein
MEKCQICGRRPAKRMHFKGHRGFILARQVVDIGGVFCRDHALEAYAAAQSISLKGMWFSGGSMLFGTIRSLWDSAKLLDLPSEVKDEPWIAHIFGCPACKAKNVSPAGPSACAACGEGITVVSCASCGIVHAKQGNMLQECGTFACRSCGSSTDVIHGCRNWPALLVGQAACECCAEVAESAADLEPTDDAFTSGMRTAFAFNDDTLKYLHQYYSACRAGKTRNTLDGCVSHCGPRLSLIIIPLILGFVNSVRATEGAARAVVERIARKLGVDPRQAFRFYEARTGPSTSKPWWEVLDVSTDATFDQATFAYRRLASLFHPDRWTHASESQREEALKRMKEINAAFDLAKEYCATNNSTEQTSSQTASPSHCDEPTPCGDAEGEATDHATIEAAAEPSSQTNSKQSNATVAYGVGVAAIAITLAIAVSLIINNRSDSGRTVGKIQANSTNARSLNAAPTRTRNPHTSDLHRETPAEVSTPRVDESGSFKHQSNAAAKPIPSRKRRANTLAGQSSASPSEKNRARFKQLKGHVTAIGKRDATLCVVRFPDGPVSPLVGKRGRVYRDGVYLGEYLAEEVRGLALAGTYQRFVPAIGDVVVFDVKR